MELQSFAQLHQRLVQRKNKQVLAVAGAADVHVLEPVVAAQSRGLIDVVLVGDKEKICSVLTEMGSHAGTFEIVQPNVDESDAQAAVRIVRAGGANVLMKGMMETSDFLRPVVNRDSGLGTGRIMSHFGIHELKGYRKLIAVTDAAMCTFPDLEKKKGIVSNVVEAYRALGYSMPKVACLCCKETVDPKLQDTVDAAQLHELAEKGEFGCAYVSGPISYDIAMSRELAALKQYPDLCYSENFDILLMPNIHAGNILGKCLCLTCKAEMGGIVAGAKVPIVLTSRSATPEEKLNSIALAGAVAD